ncbi:alkaline phosphatase D family protein [Tistrella bauzanensis]|uniref:alkaline phosphatase D family protein n=1 Tax=Tistrella TaxID=171436 RepID=UPI0031F66313
MTSRSPRSADLRAPILPTRPDTTPVLPATAQSAASPAIPRRGILKAGVAGLMLAGLPAPAGARIPQPARPVTRVALMSCIHQARPAPALDLVVGYDPDIAIFAGDNVYGDVSGPEMTELAAAYALAATRPAFTALRRDRLVMPIWDDHDYGINDGGADFPHKAAAKALFQDFWDVSADDPRRSRAGLYHAAITGPEGRRVQVILLDCRSFRSPLIPTRGGQAPGGGRYVPSGPGRAMLGADQWAWLADQLRQPAELRLVVSSIQVIADGHGWESWRLMADERARLWRLIRDTGARGVVLLSGDRHLGALYRTGPSAGGTGETEGPPYPVTELTASSVNLPNLAIADEPGPNRLGRVWPMENWGRIDIDWWQGTVTLAVVDDGGITRRQAVLRIADLA